jgi:DNA-binding NarL/FixJ family response regulator
MNNGSTPSPFGACDDDDLEDLDHAMAMMHFADELRRSARQRAGQVMVRMLGKGAQRKAIAARAGVNDQTVSNIAFGISKKPTPTKAG